MPKADFRPWEMHKLMVPVKELQVLPPPYSYTALVHLSRLWVFNARASSLVEVRIKRAQGDTK